MLAFESLTPQELLKEIAEYLRMRGLQLGIEAHVTAITGKRTTQLKRSLAEARENALKLAAVELEGAGILPPKSKLRTAPAEPDAFGQACIAVAELGRALGVIVLNRRIREWLEQNDPKAFTQAVDALTAYEPAYAAKLAEARLIADGDAGAELCEAQENTFTGDKQKRTDAVLASLLRDMLDVYAPLAAATAEAQGESALHSTVRKARAALRELNS